MAGLLYDGFEEFDIAVSGATIHGRRGGTGPPLLWVVDEFRRFFGADASATEAVRGPR